MGNTLTKTSAYGSVSNTENATHVRNSKRKSFDLFVETEGKAKSDDVLPSPSGATEATTPNSTSTGGGFTEDAETGAEGANADEAPQAENKDDSELKKGDGSDHKKEGPPLEVSWMDSNCFSNVVGVGAGLATASCAVPDVQPYGSFVVGGLVIGGHALTSKRFDRVDKRFDGVDKRFDGVDERFDGVDERFDGIDKRLDGIDKRLVGIDEKIDILFNEQQKLVQNVVVLQEGQEKLEEGFNKMQDDISGIKTILEALVEQNDAANNAKTA